MRREEKGEERCCEEKKEAQGEKGKAENPSEGDPRVPQEGEEADDEVEDWFHGNHDVDPNWLVDTFHREEDPKDMELSQVKFIRSVWEAITNWVNVIQEGVKEQEAITNWVNEIQEGVKEQDSEGAWDDVHGGELPYDKVKAAREEEIGFMEERGIWTLKPISECWEKTGKRRLRSGG